MPAAALLLVGCGDPGAGRYQAIPANGFYPPMILDTKTGCVDQVVLEDKTFVTNPVFVGNNFSEATEASPCRARDFNNKPVGGSKK